MKQVLIFYHIKTRCYGILRAYVHILLSFLNSASIDIFIKSREKGLITKEHIYVVMHIHISNKTNGIGSLL